MTLPSAGLSPIPSAPGASGAGSLPDLQALPESPAASFCLPVTQVPRSGRRKGSLSAGPRGSGVRASVAQTRAGWGPGRLEGRRCLLPPVVPLTATALQKHPSGVQRRGSHAVVGSRAECGAAQSGPRCSRALQQVYLGQNSVLSLLWSSMAILFTLKPTDYCRNAKSLTASPFSRQTFHLGLEEGA